MTVLPVTVEQEVRLRRDRAYDGRCPTNPVASAFELRGPLDVRSLERAFNAIIARHDALRAGFQAGGLPGSACQTIASGIAVALDVEDLDGDAVDRRVLAIACEPFDFATPPLARLRLLRLEPERHVAVLVVDHIVCDGWSMVVLLRELGAFYDAYRAGAHLDLGAPGMAYADVVALAGGGDGAERYWTSRHDFDGVYPEIHLPWERRGPVREWGPWAAVRHSLPAGVTGEIRRWCTERRVSLFMLGATATQVACGLTAIGPHHGVVTAFANRPQRRMYDVVAWLARPVMLRSPDLSTVTLGDAALATREETLGAMAHSAYSMAALARRLSPGDYWMHPRVPFVFFSLHAMTPMFAPSGVTVRPLPLVVPRHLSHGLAVTLVDEGDDLSFVVRFEADRYEEAGMIAFARSLALVAGAVVSTPDLPAHELRSRLR